MRRDGNSSARSPPFALPPCAGARARHRGNRGRLAVAQRARDLADRHRRPEPELPALRRQAEGHVRPEPSCWRTCRAAPARSAAWRWRARRRTATPFCSPPTASSCWRRWCISGNPVNVKRDFAPIALMFTFPFLLVVNPSLGVQDAQGARRLRQGAAGRAQLGLARHRHRRASGDRIAAEADRHQGPARALSRHDAADSGRRRRHPAIHLRHRPAIPRASATPAR